MTRVRALALCGTKVVRLAAAAGLAASLAGCYTAQQASIETVPTDYRQRHPITLQEGRRTVEVFVGSSRGALTPEGRADVLAFAGSWKREATGGILIDVPSGTPNDRAAGETTHEIQSILTSAGVPAQAIATRPYRPVDSNRLATIKLVYPKITAEAGPCGLWPNDLGPSDFAAWDGNKPYWNLGCATQRNLAAMVDNPADLAQPRAEGEVYAARRATVLDKYRQGQTTETQYPNATRGRISNVGN
jgi:pilus assembly protein CpaD